MLVIVALWGTDRVLTPSPVYSKTLETPPLTVNLLKTSKIISLAATIGCSLPIKLILHTLGVLI